MKVRQLTTCQTCRTRKLGCDGKTPECSQCSLRGLKCPGYPQDWIFVPQDTGRASGSNKEGRGKGKKTREMLLNGDRGSIQRPISAPVDEFISVIVRTCSPDPTEIQFRGKPFRVCGAWVEVLPDLLAGRTNKTLLNAIEAFAVSILSGGPVPTAPLSAGLEAKTQALSSLQKALCTTGATYSDELAATVMCVLFAELFLPTSWSAWVAHLEGFMQVMQLSRPEMYTSGLSHKLFVGARPSMIVLGFFTRKAVFVAEDRWRTVPFAQQPPSPVQEVMGEGARIPGILEQIDLLEGQSHESIMVGAQRVLEELFDLLDRLNSWKASYPLVSSSMSYWFKPAALGSRPSIWFDNIMIANALHHFWAFKAICLENIERLRLTYPMLMLTDDIFAGYIEHRNVFEEVRSLSIMICQSIEYLMQDEMKLFGPTSAILPLRVAFDTFRVGGASTAEELEWCESIFDYIMERGYHFVTMFFPESRRAMKMEGRCALMARFNGALSISRSLRDD
ncbi:hypothetical protein V8F33_006950 [Rhypophila sp. PSN 637]